MVVPPAKVNFTKIIYIYTHCIPCIWKLTLNNNKHMERVVGTTDFFQINQNDEILVFRRTSLILCYQKHNEKHQPLCIKDTKFLAFVHFMCEKSNSLSKISMIVSHKSYKISQSLTMSIHSMRIWWMFCMTKIITNWHWVNWIQPGTWLTSKHLARKKYDWL